YDYKNLRHTTDHVICSVLWLEPRNSANSGLYPRATIMAGRAEQNGIEENRWNLKKSLLNASIH
ncbi:unnamed protein product, partial [Mesorhabditis spiculigera]